MNVRKIVLVSGLLASTVLCRAQLAESCLEDILSWESKVYEAQFEDPTEILELRYSILTEDWEGKVVRSKVQIYRSQGKVHFFSQQADIYQDTEHVFLVLHPQQLIILNDSPEAITKSGFDDDFLEMRKSFFEESKLEECRSEANLKIARLKVQEDPSGIILIDRMAYRFDTRQQKLLTTEITYKPAYKVKRIMVHYDELSTKAQYDFGEAAWQHVLNLDGSPITQFKKYQLMDNR